MAAVDAGRGTAINPYIRIKGYTRIALCVKSASTSTGGGAAAPEPRCVTRRNPFNMWLFGADPDAGSVVARLDLEEPWLNFPARRNGVRTPRVKPAAGGWVDRRRHIAFEDDALA